MRLKLYFELENEKMPIQYRKNIISFIKASLNKYNEEEFKKLYDGNKPIIKPYTFSVFFEKPQFEKEQIILNSKTFEINMAVADYEVAVVLYNSFNHQKNKKFSINQNSWKLTNIAMLPEKKINGDSINVKFQSPLVARNRQEQKDYYYSFESPEMFLETLKINIKEELKITDIPQEIVNTFEINPIEPKKVVIKFYEKQIEASTGIFKIKGDKQLLEYLYKAGIGSKRSAGFGMFQIL